MLEGFIKKKGQLGYSYIVLGRYMLYLLNKKHTLILRNISLASSKCLGLNNIFRKQMVEPTNLAHGSL
jgi:hypothetical protein